LSLSLSVISTSLAQPYCKCFNFPVGVALNVRFITHGMFAKNNTHTHVARTSNKWSWQVISIAACCHAVKFCTLAARAFRTQHYY